MSEPNIRACDFCDGTGKFYSREAIAAEGGDDPDCAACEGTGRLPSPMPEPSTTIDYSRDPGWTDSHARVAAAHTLVAWAKSETPCVECGATCESGAFDRPCPATVSGYHRTEDPDDA